MPKSLADLRSQKRKKPNERAYTLCLAHDLVAEVQALDEELGRLSVDRHEQRDEDGERTGPPARMGGGGPQAQRAKEVHARLAELLDEMAEYEGELRVRANLSDGAWRQWCNDHPARDEDEPGFQRDQQVTFGFCNADDLIDDLATYAHTWNGEPLEDGDWEMLGVGNADKKHIATLIVGMYERDVSLPKWRSVLSANLARENGSTSPDGSGSPSGDSSAGSPEKSTEATTGTETESL